MLVSSAAAGPRREQRKPPSQESINRHPSPPVGFDPHEFQSAAEWHPITQQAGKVIIKHGVREGGSTSPEGEARPRARRVWMDAQGPGRALRRERRLKKKTKHIVSANESEEFNIRSVGFDIPAESGFIWRR